MPKVLGLKMAGKNPAIELIRIIACLLVIMAHSQVPIVDGSSIVNGRLAVSTIIADDVPLFLLVTGFFFFGRVKSDGDIFSAFKYKLKSFAVNIYVPTLIYIIIAIFFKYSIDPNVTSLANADWNYLERFIFRLAPGDHLWYICTYMSFVFFFPMLAFLCQNDPQKNKMRRTLLCFAIGYAVVGDVLYFLRHPVLDLDKFLWGYCTIFLILGYELSLFVPKFLSKVQKLPRLKLALIGAGIYLLGFAVKFGLQLYMFGQFNYVDNRFRWLQCSPCFVTAVGLFLLIYAIGSLIKKDGKFAWMVNFVGSSTFMIYLFHQLAIMKTLQWRTDIWFKLDACKTVFDSFAFYLGYGLAVLAVTLPIAMVFKLTFDNSLGRILKK